MIEFESNKDKGFTPIPEGTYDLQIEAVNIGTSQSGNDQLIVSSVVAEGAYEGRKVTMWYTLVPKAGWKLRSLLDATDVVYDVTDEGNEAERISFEETDLVGRYFRATATIREWNGKEKNDWNNETGSKFAKTETEEPEAPEAAAKADNTKPRRRRERQVSA